MSDTNEPRRVPAKRPSETSQAGQAKPTGNSMKDRLLAERRAAELAAESAQAAPAKPSARPAKPAATVPATKPAAAKPATAPRAPTSAKPAATPSGAARPSRPARATGDGDEGSGRRAHHREPKPKQKSPIPFIATGLVIIVGAFAAYKYVNLDETDAEAPGVGGNKVAAADGAGAAADGAAAVTDEGAAVEGGTQTPTEETAAANKTETAAKAPVELTADEAAALKEVKGLPSAKDPDSWNTLAITKNPNQVNDPNGVDLTKITPYGKPPGTEDAQWDTLVADAKAMFDPLSGAKGNRAETRLLEAGINAWPAVTNEMLKLDPRRPDDNRTGKRAEKLLDKLRGGTTEGGFNWRMPATSDGELERKDLFYNLQLIVELHDVWRRHLVAPDRYFREKIAKGTVQEEMMGKAPAAEGDELDVDALDLSDLGGG